MMKRWLWFFMIIAMCTNNVSAGWLFRDLKYFPERCPATALWTNFYQLGFYNRIERVLRDLPHYYTTWGYTPLYELCIWLGSKDPTSLDTLLVKIHDNLGDADVLTALKKLLILFDADHVVFFVLAKLDEKDLEATMHENELVKNWCRMSRGDDWSYFQQLKKESPVNFAEKFLRWASRIELEKLFGQELADLANYQKEGNIEGIEIIKDQFFTRIQTRRDLVVEFNLTHDNKLWKSFLEQNSYYKKNSSSLQSFLELNTLFGDEGAAKENIEKVNAMVEPYEDEQERPNELQVAFILTSNNCFFKSHAKLLCSTLSIPCLAYFFVLIHLKRIGSMFRKKSCWIHWNQLSLSELEESSPDRIVNIIIPDILMRRHSKKIFCSNEKILNDFLRDIEYEHKMLNFCGTWGKRMGLLSRLIGVDSALVHSAPTRLKKLELLHQKVWDYIIATKSMKAQLA